MAVDLAGPVVVAVAGAADLHLLAAAFRSACAAAAPSGLHAEEHGQASSSHTVAIFSPCGSSFTSGATFCSMAPNTLLPSARHLDADRVAELHEGGAAARRARSSRARDLGDADQPAPVLVADRAEPTMLPARACACAPRAR
jgi:hypothetical protein